MLRTITPSEMKRVETRVMRETSLTGERLMQNAAAHVARAVRRWAAGRAGRVVCLCGTGNNGGDGLAAMRMLLEEDPDALAVPYDAVYENSQGQTCLLVLEEGEDGALLLTEMPVETGLETDLDIAVTGEGIGEGTSVVTDPERYLPLLGREVVLETAGEAG